MGGLYYPPWVLVQLSLIMTPQSSLQPPALRACWRSRWPYPSTKYLLLPAAKCRWGRNILFVPNQWRSYVGTSRSYTRRGMVGRSKYSIETSTICKPERLVVKKNGENESTRERSPNSMTLIICSKYFLLIDSIGNRFATQSSHSQALKAKSNEAKIGKSKKGRGKEKSQRIWMKDHGKVNLQIIFRWVIFSFF